ncbi:hypothetical protein SAMN05428642_101884 [Flaviramulus basaltis]|uniref:Uncharacterized protein n=1 Tax=Flaviramulus basaltis TaxID=369401 RepID=A0A1K2ID50_9FLAO|nr:hypothetical protein [Flaviramulus basaltis]SFZ90349.1 hypothetical protein SAMN05428642_101884 [Flaviramulus basaltis]
MANNTGQKFGGRKKGTANKNTLEIRRKFQTLVENNLEVLQADLDKLKPVERVKIIIELGKFVLPTLKAIEVQTDIKQPKRPQFVFMRKPEQKTLDISPEQKIKTRFKM